MSINYKEVNNMPRRDGIGPMGAGSMTGRGLGLCTGTNAEKNGIVLGIGAGPGLACRQNSGRGSGRGFAMNRISSITKKELLRKQKTMLQDRLETIERQLENL